MVREYTMCDFASMKEFKSTFFSNVNVNYIILISKGNSRYRLVRSNTQEGYIYLTALNEDIKLSH